MKKRENPICFVGLLIAIALAHPISEPAETPVARPEDRSLRRYYPTPPLRTGLSAIDDEALDELEMHYDEVIQLRSID
jgi:hypothetical protein